MSNERPVPEFDAYMSSEILYAAAEFLINQGSLHGIAVRGELMTKEQIGKLIHAKLASAVFDSTDPEVDYTPKPVELSEACMARLKEVLRQPISLNLGTVEVKVDTDEARALVEQELAKAPQGQFVSDHYTQQDFLDFIVSKKGQDVLHGRTTQPTEDDLRYGRQLWVQSMNQLAARLQNSASQSHPEADQDELMALAQVGVTFGCNIANKLMTGFINKGRKGWDNDDWSKAACNALLQATVKGDPVDVAAYAAFMEHHGWTCATTDMTYCLGDKNLLARVRMWAERMGTAENNHGPLSVEDMRTMSAWAQSVVSMFDPGCEDLPSDKVKLR